MHKYKVQHAAKVLRHCLLCDIINYSTRLESTPTCVANPFLRSNIHDGTCFFLWNAVCAKLNKYSSTITTVVAGYTTYSAHTKCEALTASAFEQKQIICMLASQLHKAVGFEHLFFCRLFVLSATLQRAALTSSQPVKVRTG